MAATALSLKNPIPTLEQLLECPSRRDGVPEGTWQSLSDIWSLLEIQVNTEKTIIIIDYMSECSVSFTSLFYLFCILDIEKDLRALGCELIQAAGILLKL